MRISPVYLRLLIRKAVSDLTIAMIAALLLWDHHLVFATLFAVLPFVAVATIWWSWRCRDMSVSTLSLRLLGFALLCVSAWQGLGWGIGVGAITVTLSFLKMFFEYGDG